MELQVLIPGLLVLVSLFPAAEALAPYSPQLCYILDGFLGLYGIIITAMFINEKFFKAKVKRVEKSTYNDPEGQTSGPHNQPWRRDRGMDDATYTGLKPRREESYKELPAKRERHRKSEQVYQDLRPATRDTYDSLQMQPLPR